jgi:hypothetical protein
MFPSDMFPWAAVSYLKEFFHISGKFAEILKPEVDSAVQMIQPRKKKEYQVPYSGL